MSDLSDQDLTEPLRAWNLGEGAALQRLVPAVYGELHRLVSVYMGRERSGHTLRTTALIHEAHLRLAARQGIKWQDRHHFYAVSAGMMRRILVDWAQARRTGKRGGGMQRVSLEEGRLGSWDRSFDWVTLDQALEALCRVDERKSTAFELKRIGSMN